MKQTGHKMDKVGLLSQKLRPLLPFAFTDDQEKAVREIKDDMKHPARMLRLLQGDVGAGKTLVAFEAMLHAVENGFQAALMAPTEILARQHQKTISPLCEQLGIGCVVLTGSDKGKRREKLLTHIANKTAQIIIGTHTLFQENITFAKLGFVVVDEQHRFGVHQRLTLSKKGHATDILVMTATPIPRTLSLVAYGDMDVSFIKEKPKGRKEIKTALLSLKRIDELVGKINEALSRNEKIYWVCPLIEESQSLDLAAAKRRADDLKEKFGNQQVGLLHGKMTSKEKTEIIDSFQSNKIKILVATTIIEVGIDAPDVNIIIIEDSERFGLAQLHQLRGRVGRGQKQASCVLLYKTPLGQTAKARLEMMRKSNDGFLLAEEDLRLRGEGDTLGTRQTGLPRFRLANLGIHQDLLKAANDDVRIILQQDKDLLSERGKALRLLLYLFQRDEATRFLRSG